MTDRPEQQLNRFRERIAEELAGIRGLMAASEEDRSPVQLDQQSAGRLTRMDAMQRQAMASETQRRRQLRMRKLEQALRRLDEGEFGYCAECGDMIPDGRLAVDPTFHLCVQCAE